MEIPIEYYRNRQFGQPQITSHYHLILFWSFPGGGSGKDPSQSFLRVDIDSSLTSAVTIYSCH